MKINEILNEVIEEIRPDESYKKEIFQRVNQIISKINQNNAGARAKLGGSGAKGTWLKNFDADIFVMFSYARYSDKSDKISDILETILRKKFKQVSRLHGSRDYFQIKDKEYSFEIIPILEIRNSSKALNITDISPLHARWVLKHKRLANQMKLTKQFCKANNLYGAESYIRGFSGYVCEILTVYYGSFLSVAKNASRWHDKTVIDVKKFYKGKDVFKIINASKLESPLIVIDPVQKDRNAAAALSFDKFNRFREAASAFIKDPSKKFFAQKMLKEELKAKYRSKKIIRVTLKPLEGKTDVSGSKLVKIGEFISSELSKQGFEVLESDWEWNRTSDAYFYFVFGKDNLTDKIVLDGPLLSMQDHAKNFKKAHKKTFTKKGRLYAFEKRRFKSPQDLIKSLLKGPYSRQRSLSSKMEFL